MPSAATVHFVDDMDYSKDGHDSDPKREEYRRQKLTDVEEEVDENDQQCGERSLEAPPYRKTRNYSVSSNISMDTLWELHPRRLSEAGLRRHSDTSVVLTEDTDCFIIGMRVWVGGTKPGQIAYLGETQFAPGEWAGIVLDETIGKNDGSVSGTRYFQCEPKRGVFSRLTRLTLEPLAGAEDIQTLCTPPNANGTRKSSASPAGSIRASPSLNTSTTSLSSSMMMHDVKLGDRVIVQSSQGSKAGTLRFLGPTDFAKGDWCGVELNDPLGKNDGCVEGKRYFTCQPKFGLFAPLAKVSRSPSSRRPAGQCIVHKTSMPVMRRTGSRESMTSMTSVASAASSVRRVRLGVTSLSSAKKPISRFTSTPISKTPLQDVLREKEHHIEQLLKEREIDRSEITRAARHAEQTAGKLLNLQQDYEKYRVDSEIKYHGKQQENEELEKQSKLLNSQLEDEKKRLEDAQFRFEEEALNKDDIEATSKKYLIQINELEESLTRERLKNEKLEQETKRLFETEETVARIQEEMELLQKAQDQTNQSVELKNTELYSLKQQLEQSHTQLVQEKAKLAEKSNEIENITKENRVLLQEFEAKMDLLRDELNAANRALKEKHSTNEIGLLKELKRAEMELSSKTFDCETNAEQIKALELKLLHLEQELNGATENETDKEARWKTNVDDVRNVLKRTVLEFLQIRKSYALQLLEKEMALREKDIKLNYEIIELQKLKTDFTQSVLDLTQSSTANRDRYTRQIQQRNQQIDDLLINLQSRSAELVNREIFATKLEQQLAHKNRFIERLKYEMESYTGIHSEQSAYIAKLVEELKLATLKASEFERNYHHAETTVLELKEAKQQHEQQFRAILEASKDSNAQLSIINAELRCVESALNQIKTEMANKLNQAANTEQELRFVLKTQTEQYNLAKQHIEQQLKLAQNSEACFAEKLNISNKDTLKLQSDLKQQIIELQKSLYETEVQSKRQIELHVDKIKELEQILDMSIHDAQNKASALSRRIDELTMERDELKQSIKEKQELLVEAEQNAKTTQDSFHDKQINELRTQVDEYKVTLDANHLTIKTLTEDLNTLKNSHASLEQQLSDYVTQISQLTADQTESNQVLTDLKTTLQHSQDKVNDLVQQLHHLNAEKKEVLLQLNNLKVQIAELTLQVKTLQTEKENINNALVEKDAKLEQIFTENLQIKTTLEASLHENEMKMIALTTQLETIIQEKGSSSETFAQQENTITSLNMELQQITQEKSTICAQFEEKKAAYLNLSETVNQMQLQLNTASLNTNDELILLKIQIENAELEKSNLASSLNAKQQHIVTLISEIENLKQEKTVHETALNDSTIELQQRKAELQKNHVTNAEMEAKVNALEARIKERDSVCTKLEAEFQQLQHDWNAPISNPVVIELQNKLESTKKIVTDKEIEVSNLQERLHAITKERGHESEIISALEAQIVDAKTDMQQLSQDQVRLTAEVTAKSNEVLSLNDKLESQIAQKNATIVERDLEINNIKTQMEKLLIEKAGANQSVQINEQQILQLKKSVDTLEADKVKMELELIENEKQLEQLRQQVTQSSEGKLIQNVQITELEKQVKEKNSVIATLKTDMAKHEQDALLNNNAAIAELTSKFAATERMLKDKELELDILNTKVETIDNQNHQMQHTWHQSIQQWKAKLMNLEMIRQLASQECDSLEAQVKVLADQTENAQQNGNEPAQPVRFDEFQKRIDQDQKELHTALDKTQLLLIDRQKELNNHKNECTNLQKQLKEVQKRLAEVSVAVPGTVAQSGIPKKQVAKATKESVCDMASYQKMQEEKEFALGQVAFLNSIIVDMQQKNAELQTKIQILEIGFYDEAPKENANNINRVVPPRQYCDICEEFDLHETEDCPVQMTDAAVVFKDVNKSRTLPQTRPYCEICEEFGHETENCDTDETY